MHCPQCGQQPPTEQTKFCTLCGYSLDPIKELLTTGLPPGSVRQRDITLGAALMLVGALKGAFLTSSMNLHPLTFALMSGAFFGLLQMFFQLSPRQKGLSLGATLMFLSSLVAFLFLEPTHGFGVLLVAAIAIPIILLWQKLAAGFQKTFFDKTEIVAPRAIPQTQFVAALPPEQSPAVDTNRVWPTDSMEPAGIPSTLTAIEGTTRSLGA